MFPTVRLHAVPKPKTLFSLKVTRAVLDVIMLSGAFGFAYLLRFEFSLDAGEKQQALFQMLWTIPLQLAVLRLCKVHKFIWRYIGLTEGKRILTALLIAVFPILTLRIFLPDSPVATPLSIIIMDFCLASIGILGIRILRREIYENMRRAETSMNCERKKNVLLIGAGRAGLLTLAEIKSRRDLDFEVKGFIDDEKFKRKPVINGVEVVGDMEKLPELVGRMNIDHVIITIAQTSRRDFQRIVNICKEIPVKVKTIPAMSELLEEKVIVSRIRNVEIKDLLGRAPVQLDEESIKTFLSGKVVLVTGAGGSIGSELVRQLLHCAPKELVLVERSEFALFNIERELRALSSSIKIVPVIGDVCDANRMRGVFERFQPQVVFHAAAYKHVPMMEFNSVEALKNNVQGTNTVGMLAGQTGAEAFVLISTDKAVNPTSIMGATKRTAELIIQDLNNRFATRFVAVRFGNVIGSNGSVIPIFQEQIKAGGPVTVTHPQMKRFFMTIPEASQLVLQAGALGAGGEIFILDMGEPVSILDLAKETIRLSGLKPDEDIQIAYTGMRPGEKLTEELEITGESLLKTRHPKIFIGLIAPYANQEIKRALSEIESLCFGEDDAKIRRFLANLLPEANLENVTAEEIFEEINLNAANIETSSLTLAALSS